MAQLSDDVAVWDQDGGRVLWQQATGDFAVAPPNRDLPEMLLKRKHMLATDPPDLARMIPARMGTALTLPNRPALWLPVPTANTAGGRPYRALPLDEQTLALWRAADGQRTLSQVASTAGLGLRQTANLIRGLAAADIQAMKLLDSPPRARDPRLFRILGLQRPDNERSDDQRGDHGQTTLTEYHLHHITDGQTHFDDRETTVAHAHAVAHAMLGGRPFGEALHAGLSERGLVPESGRIAEVGCGTGELAAAFWSTAQRPGLSYWRADLSPELLRTQAGNAPNTLGVLANALAMPFADQSIDLILNNEVIADLSAGPIDTPGVATRIERYELERFGSGALYNLGAWQFVEECARVLRPGGAAYLSEFGSLDDPPEEAVQLDHPEVSIHFGQLAQVATALGLRAQVVPLADLLGANLHSHHLARHSYMGLRALCRSRDVHLPARAWTTESVAQHLPEPVEGLVSVPVSEPGPGPLITRFFALLLIKP